MVDLQMEEMSKVAIKIMGCKGAKLIHSLNTVGKEVVVWPKL
jgi:hypothetical protein